jgi:hypothetical protein
MYTVRAPVARSTLRARSMGVPPSPSVTTFAASRTGRSSK